MGAVGEEVTYILKEFRLLTIYAAQTLWLYIGLSATLVLTTYQVCVYRGSVLVDLESAPHCAALLRAG